MDNRIEKEQTTPYQVIGALNAIFYIFFFEKKKRYKLCYHLTHKEFCGEDDDVKGAHKNFKTNYRMYSKEQQSYDNIRGTLVTISLRVSSLHKPTS